VINIVVQLIVKGWRFYKSRKAKTQPKNKYKDDNFTQISHNSHLDMDKEIDHEDK